LGDIPDVCTYIGRMVKMKEIGECDCGWKGEMQRQHFNDCAQWQCPGCMKMHRIPVRKVPAFHNEKGERVRLDALRPFAMTVNDRKEGIE